MRDFLAPVVRYPQHQWMDLGAILTVGNALNVTMALDSASWSNHIIQTSGAQGDYITFMFLLGPQYARHEIIFTHLRGPSYGIQTPYMAKLAETPAAAMGYLNPLQLIANAYNGLPAANWVSTGGGQSFYNAVTTRNIVEGYNFRVEGGEGAAFTAVATDSDGFHGINGGPGVYAMQFRMDTKDGIATGYKGAWSEIGVHRIDDSGFV